VHEKWLEYVDKYKDFPPSFQIRSEPTITKGLSAYLTDQAQLQRQPFPGDFFGELSAFDLAPNGTPVCTKRTDIEWCLHGIPSFIIEFKILDGTANKRKSYLSDGIGRFVDGRYAPAAKIAAMCALLRSAGVDDPSKIEALIEENEASLQIQPPGGPFIHTPSKIVPTIARFDTVHSRTDSVAIELAHLFWILPEQPQPVAVPSVSKNE
jgi:hypothetical protein